MSKVYNQVGTLTTIKTQLYSHDIKDLHFKSIFSREETQMIADYLLRICTRKN